MCTCYGMCLVPWWQGVVELTCSRGTGQRGMGFCRAEGLQSAPLTPPHSGLRASLGCQIECCPCSATQCSTTWGPPVCLFSGPHPPCSQAQVLTGPVTGVRQTVFPVTQTSSEALPMEELGLGHVRGTWQPLEPGGASAPRRLAAKLAVSQLPRSAKKDLSHS